MSGVRPPPPPVDGGLSGAGKELGETETNGKHTRSAPRFPSSQKKPVSGGLQARSGRHRPARHQRGSISHLTPGTHLGRLRPKPQGFRSHQTGRELSGNTPSRPATGPASSPLREAGGERGPPRGARSCIRAENNNNKPTAADAANSLLTVRRAPGHVAYGVRPSLSMTASVRERYGRPRFTRKSSRDSEGIMNSPKVMRPVPKRGFEPRGLQDSETRALTHCALDLAESHHCDFPPTF